jgi:tripartite-type tricarboxylate transporter receptor subunit TctC
MSIPCSLPPASDSTDQREVRALGVASARRAAALPDTPTFEEAGWPKFVVDSRYGLVAPAGTPAANIAKLNAAIAKAAASTEIKERYAAIGLEPAYSPQQEFAAYVRDDISGARSSQQPG